MTFGGARMANRQFDENRRSARPCSFYWKPNTFRYIAAMCARESRACADTRTQRPKKTPTIADRKAGHPRGVNNRRLGLFFLQGKSFFVVGGWGGGGRGRVIGRVLGLVCESHIVCVCVVQLCMCASESA